MTFRDNVTVAAGNTTMIHLFYGVDPRHIREEPYIPTVNFVPTVPAAALGVRLAPGARVCCVPGRASYVGGDITAGLLASGVYRSDRLTLYIDIGTNGEMALGNREWLLSCACSAGPAFEGGSVKHGMRAVLGAIAVVGGPTLDATGVEATGFLCRNLGLALRNLGRLRQVEHLAYLDDLTHLYNTRYLEVALERETQSGRPFTVLFMDLDHFKTVNDQHGHLSGSRMLVEVARVLRSCVRDDDVLVRYGGDEYVVLLVGIDSGGGLKVAERIRRAVEDHRFLSREGARVRVTASIGLASYPEHAQDKSEILDLADRAMYRGKRSSRNVVYIASHDLPPVPAGDRT